MAELYHYGVKGMKWGVRKNSRTPTSGRRLRKQVKRAKKENRLIRTQKVYGKVISDLSKTKEAKDLQSYSKMLVNMQKSFEKEHPGKKLYFSQEFATLQNELESNYRKKGQELLLKHKDEIASSVLKDLGYEDTSEGREFVKKYTMASWD